jgi:hypothetical protein
LLILWSFGAERREKAPPRLKNTAAKSCADCGSDGCKPRAGSGRGSGRRRSALLENDHTFKGKVGAGTEKAIFARHFLYDRGLGCIDLVFGLMTGSDDETSQEIRTPERRLQERTPEDNTKVLGGVVTKT